MIKFEDEAMIDKEEKELKKSKKRKKKQEKEEASSIEQTEAPKKKKKKKEKTMTIYAVVNYDTDFKEWLTAYVNEDKAAKLIKPLTFCSTSADAEAYCEQYFFMYNYKHFKMWCDCHEGEDLSSAQSWLNYVDKVLSIDDDPDRQYLKICSFEFPLSEVSSLLRLTLNSLPVGLSTEDPEIIPEIMIEAISEGDHLRDNYLQVLNGMKEYYKDYETKNNQQNNYCVSEIIEHSLDLYMRKIEELDNENNEKYVN